VIRLLKSILLATMLIFMATPVAAKGTLALLIDMSNSVNHEEMALQIGAYEQALSEMIWLDDTRFEVITYATEIEHRVKNGTRADAIKFFSNFQERTDRPPGQITCIYKAAKQIEAIYSSLPKPVIVDITGDGGDNCGDESRMVDGFPDVKKREHPSDIFDRIAATDWSFRVNTLFIGDPERSFNVHEEFIDFSMSETNGFSMSVRNFYDFEYALFEKLILETSFLLDTE